MMDWADYSIWAYRGVFKQTNAGGGSVVARFTMRERTVLLFGRIGPNDYAAGRTLQGIIREVGATDIGILMDAISIDNISIPFPHDGAVDLLSGQANQFHTKVILAKGDYLNIVVASLIQNEELTVALRMMFRSWPPAVSSTGSAGTVTITEEYNKVV